MDFDVIFISITNYNLPNLFISSHLFLFVNLLTAGLAPFRPFSSHSLVDDVVSFGLLHFSIR